MQKEDPDYDVRSARTGSKSHGFVGRLNEFRNFWVTGTTMNGYGKHVRISRGVKTNRYSNNNNTAAERKDQTTKSMMEQVRPNRLARIVFYHNGYKTSLYKEV